MSTKDQFLFLVFTSVNQDSKNQYDKDLQARAHAARRSHASRRGDTTGPNKQETQTALHSPAGPSKFSMATHQRKLRLAITSGNPVPAVTAKPWSRTPFDNGNDEPFDSLAVTGLPAYVFSVLQSGKS